MGHTPFSFSVLLILLGSLGSGCTSSPPIEPIAILPRALTDGKIVGIGGALPDRGGISGGKVFDEYSEPGNIWDGEIYEEPVPRGLFRYVSYAVKDDTVVSAFLIDGRDAGFNRAELELALRTMCVAYGNSVWFGTPLTIHSPDRIDTMLVWDLGNNVRAELWYWRYMSDSSYNNWQCEIKLMLSPESDTLPRREINCFQQ